MSSPVIWQDRGQGEWSAPQLGTVGDMGGRHSGEAGEGWPMGVGGPDKEVRHVDWDTWDWGERASRGASRVTFVGVGAQAGGSGGKPRITGVKGRIFLRKRRFLLDTRSEPSTCTVYAPWSKTSTTRPVVVHLPGLRGSLWSWIAT